MMIRMGPNGYRILEHFEQGPFGGFAAVPYQGAADKEGIQTVGWGHVIRPGESFNRPITRQEADDILTEDMDEVEKQLNKLLSLKEGIAAQVDQHHFDAMACLVFNVGAGVRDGKKGDFADSTLLNHVLNLNFQLAAAEFDKWVYSNGKIQNGLVRRRKVEKYLFTNGVLPKTFFP